MTATKLKEVVEHNRKFLDIPSRVTVNNMVLFTRELLIAEGYKDAAFFCECLFDALEHIDTEEIIKEKIWVKGVHY